MGTFDNKVADTKEMKRDVHEEVEDEAEKEISVGGEKKVVTSEDSEGRTRSLRFPQRRSVILC